MYYTSDPVYIGFVHIDVLPTANHRFFYTQQDRRFHEHLLNEETSGEGAEQAPVKVIDTQATLISGIGS
jgi:hypothetical protein